MGGVGGRAFRKGMNMLGACISERIKAGEETVDRHRKLRNRKGVSRSRGKEKARLSHVLGLSESSFVLPDKSGTIAYYEERLSCPRFTLSYCDPIYKR